MILVRTKCPVCHTDATQTPWYWTWDTKRLAYRIVCHTNTHWFIMVPIDDETVTRLGGGV